MTRVRVSEEKQPQTEIKMSTRNEIKHSSTKNVDAYQKASPQKLDDKWIVITAYSRTADDQGGYAHALTLRDATAQELSAIELEGFKRTLRCFGFERAELAAMTSEEICAAAAERKVKSCL